MEEGGLKSTLSRSTRLFRVAVLPPAVPAALSKAASTSAPRTAPGFSAPASPAAPSAARPRSKKTVPEKKRST